MILTHYFFNWNKKYLCTPNCFCNNSMYKAGANCVYLNKWYVNLIKKNCTGKSVSEALILESVDPKYGDRLFKKIPNMSRTCCVQKLFWMSKQKQNMSRTCCACAQKNLFCFDIQNNFCKQHMFLNNLSSYCGLTD